MTISFSILLVCLCNYLPFYFCYSSSIIEIERCKNTLISHSPKWYLISPSVWLSLYERLSCLSCLSCRFAFLFVCVFVCLSIVCLYVLSVFIFFGMFFSFLKLYWNDSVIFWSYFEIWGKSLLRVYGFISTSGHNLRETWSRRTP